MAPSRTHTDNADFIEACRALADRIGPDAVLDGVVAALATDLGRAGVLGDLRPCGELPAIPSGATVDLLGAVHEALLEGGVRRRSGSFYTPPAIAAGVVALALAGLEPDERRRLRVCDPAVGGGAFALGAARALHEAGASRHEVIRDCLWVADRDPAAAAVTTASLRLWAASEGVPPDPNVVVADTLITAPSAWQESALASSAGFDLVVGNPPFLGQLRGGSVRSRQEASALRDALGDAARGYSDTAALFLLAALHMVRPGGRIALILPESILGASDSAAVREQVAEGCSLLHLWLAGQPVFEVSARVCVPVLERTPTDGAQASEPEARRVGRSVGPRFEAAKPVDVTMAWLREAPTWGVLVAGLLGVPEVTLAGSGTLGDWCGATAGFRDQYYGLVPFVVEGEGKGLDDDAFPRLVTSGAIDPARCRWGDRPIRFARQAWSEPRVDLAALAEVDPVLHRWTVDRLRPKVVIAAQTRVIEAAADADGCWFPSTPTVSVEPPADRLWECLAVLLAPPVSAWILSALAGTALAADHVRLPAAHVRRIPLPDDLDALGEGARLARVASEAGDEERTACLLDLGATMCRAYRVGDDVLEWWAARLPAPVATR